MKTKKFIVEIKPLKEALADFARAFAKGRDNQITESRGVSFSDVETFRKFFSQKRMELLSTIKNQKPKSIYQLAQISSRQYKNVYDDVKFMQELGLLDTDKNIHLRFDKLMIEVAV